MNKWSLINLFNFLRHYKSPPFHIVTRIHLVIISYFSFLAISFSFMEQMFILMLMFQRQQQSM